MNIFRLIRQFKAATGRSPTPNELSKLKQQAEAMSAQDNIIQFPNKMEFPPKKSLKEFTEAEDAFEASKLRGNETFDELIDPTRIKGGISTRIKLNSFRENEQYAKDLIGGKSSEFNILKGDDRKEILDLLDKEITKGKTPPTSTDDMPFADGGRAGFKVGGIAKLLKFLQSKVGKKNITTADKVGRPKSALDREMFDEANKRFNKKVNERQLTKDELEDFENEIGDGLEAYDFDGTVADAKRILKEDKAYKAEMFAEYKAEGGAKRAGGPKDPVKKAMDEVGGNFTGDLKYDADILADEIAFQRGLIPEGGDLTDIVDQNKRMDLYDEAYSAVSGQFLKNREIKKTKQFYDERESTSVFTDKYKKNLDKEVMKEFDFSKKQFDKLSEEAKENFRRQYDGNYADAMEDTAGIIIKDPRPSEPTQTLKSIKEKGAIDISDPTIADEFNTFLKENDPEAYKNLEQKIQLDTFDTKGRKKNAAGGLAYMLGEEPRSMYSGGGGAGAPPVTYDDNIDNIGPGPTMPPNTMMNTPAIDPRLLNQGRGTGIMIDQRGLQQGKIPRPTTQGLADGGRIGFKNGGMDRRGFLKLMGGLATLPVLGKFFKGAKVASKVVPLKGTTTTMPTWFPDLVDKFVAKGVGKK